MVWILPVFKDLVNSVMMGVLVMRTCGQVVGKSVGKPVACTSLRAYTN
jgi:hypothetical protein